MTPDANHATTVKATDLYAPTRAENDSSVTVDVMRSQTFLYVRLADGSTLHVSMSPEDWRKLAATPQAGTSESLAHLSLSDLVTLANSGDSDALAEWRNRTNARL